ncbi:MAG: hypothetical protein HY940_07065 [Gammaproteobacteria bacterium]|nr:hypothetical protein [Gammaproteobacteria bacterium]
MRSRPHCPTGKFINRDKWGGSRRISAPSSLSRCVDRTVIRSVIIEMADGSNYALSAEQARQLMRLLQ